MGLLTFLTKKRFTLRQDKDIKVSTDFYQWLSVKGTKVVRTAFAEDAIVNLFVVPTGQVFFLTSVFLHVKTNDLNAGAVAEIDAGGEKILTLESSNVDDDTTNMTQSYPIPPMFEENIIITVQSSSMAQFANAGLTGFTITKNELVRAKKNII